MPNAMPLRCLDPSGHSIQSFDLPADRWQALKSENQLARHLRMPCCDARATLKTSSRGTRFFAHKARGPCLTAPEKEEHLVLKRMAIEAARANGWQAESEVSGATPAGQTWTTDVLAEKNGRRVAVEVQWSGQTADETLRRQERYRISEVRGLWLLRQPGFPITYDLPAVCIGGSLQDGFSALIPWNARMHARDRALTGSWHQVVPMEVFLNAAFGRRFRFGVPLNAPATVIIKVGDGTCWHRSCGAPTRIVTRVEVHFGANQCRFSVDELGEHPELLRYALNQLPHQPGMGTIKKRFRETCEKSYFSNGCVRCDRLIGKFFEYKFCENEHIAASVDITLAPPWCDAIQTHYSHEARWSVYIL